MPQHYPSGGKKWEHNKKSRPASTGLAGRLVLFHKKSVETGNKLIEVRDHTLVPPGFFRKILIMKHLDGKNFRPATYAQYRIPQKYGSSALVFSAMYFLRIS